MRFPFSISLVLILALGVQAQALAETCYRVGTWNLEHFKDGSKRGFPERQGDRAIKPRKPSDILAIAEAIRDRMDLKILTLQEINGVRNSNPPRSNELDQLIEVLGSDYRYRIAKSGRKQRTAFLWDSRFAKLNEFHEVFVPKIEVADRRSSGSPLDPKDIFDRDPIFAHFTFLDGREERNDLLFVGLHLASQQWRVKNHDAAMDHLRDTLDDLRRSHDVYPQGEKDILVGGDMNASWYDNKRERFFDEWNEDGWVVMARKKGSYPGTRTNGSQIDYLIATDGKGRKKGLIKEEIEDDEAIVHLGLAADGRFQYRNIYSDHFPVTTCIKVGADKD